MNLTIVSLLCCSILLLEVEAKKEPRAIVQLQALGKNVTSGF